MKKLLTTRDANKMSRCHAYLQQQGIPVNVSERGEQLELWVTQTSYYALAKQLVDDFKANPEIATQASEPSPASPEPGPTPSAPSSDLLHSSILPIWRSLTRNVGPLTIAVAAIVIVVYLLLQTALAEQVFAALRISDYYNEFPAVELWRYITPAILHFSALHFIFNLFWWWYLGGRIEQALGWPVLLALFIASAVIPNSAQFYMNGPYFGGLSGVVYGLLGFCAVLSFKQPRHPLYLPPGLLVFMVVWLLLGYTDILWVNVANEAHLAGLLTGIAAAVVFRAVKRIPRQPRRPL